MLSHFLKNEDHNKKNTERKQMDVATRKRMTLSGTVRLPKDMQCKHEKWVQIVYC